MIAPLAAEHVRQVAELHCAALTGLLTNLGEAAARAYYEGCVTSGPATGFVDVVDGRVRGFVLGSARPDLLKSAVARANPTAVVAGTILGVLRMPTALSWLLKSFKGPDEGSYDHQAPELTYVAVAREARGSGVGGKLVDAFTAAMRKAGIPAYELSVDDDNAGAIAFYEGRSFALVGRYREFGVQHRRYRRETTSVRD